MTGAGDEANSPRDSEGDEKKNANDTKESVGEKRSGGEVLKYAFIVVSCQCLEGVGFLAPCPLPAVSTVVLLPLRAGDDEFISFGGSIAQASARRR